MTVAAHDPLHETARAGWAAWTVRVGRLWESALVVPVGLFGLAFAIRFWTAGLVSFPMTEGSAYYVAVARNVVAGRGLVIDAMWNYATPPFTLPRPAFELWQPMASLVAAVPMALFGPTYAAGQLGGVVLGAALAPLAWVVGRDAAARLTLSDGRRAFVALGAGILAAIVGPFLLATSVPDSTLPFTVFAVGACLFMPAAVGGDRRAVIGLGVLLGLAYLTRLEAVYLAVAFAIFAAAGRHGWREWARAILPVAVIAALVALPWWLRNLAVFGTPLPGQVAENFFLNRNEQIFAYLDRPTLAGFLAQGLPQIVGNIAAALWHNVVDVLVVPAAPIVVVGLATVGFLLLRQRRRSEPGPFSLSPLAALLLTGALTFVATSVLFPVATLWGTFEHASGPLLVALAVAAVLGGDAFVAWLVSQRGWQRQNAWLAPLALVALTVPLSLFQLASASRQAADEARAISAVAENLSPALASAGVAANSPVITDRPMWLSDALGRPALALPDEPASAVLQLAARFGSRAVVIVEQRGTYPQTLRDPANALCFTELPSLAGASAAFVIDSGCLR